MTSTTALRLLAALELTISLAFTGCVRREGRNSDCTWPEADKRPLDKIPADIVLDADYQKELRRRATLPGSSTPAVQPSDELDRQIFERAENPLFKIEAMPLTAAMIEQAVRDCRERQRQAPPK